MSTERNSPNIYFLFDGTGKNVQNNTIIAQIFKNIREHHKVYKPYYFPGPGARPYHGEYKDYVTEGPSVSGSQIKRGQGLTNGMGRKQDVQNALNKLKSDADQKSQEAREDDEITCFGYSRGAISATEFAMAVAVQCPNKKIRLYLIDPVYGGQRIAQSLPPQIKSCDVILMEGEKRKAFEAQSDKNITAQQPTQTSLQFYPLHRISSSCCQLLLS